FKCGVSPANVQRLSRALHALIGELEARGYSFKSSQQEYGNLSVAKGGDSVTIQCSEGQEQIEREPTAVDKRKPSWTWSLKETKANGKLSFEVHAWGL